MILLVLNKLLAIKSIEAMRETLSYLVCGFFSVVINILSYELLSIIFSMLIANTLAFFIAVFFAYWTNSTFVFRVQHTWKNFLQFMGMRIGTLLIDNGGMYLLTLLAINDLFAKCAVNATIIVINYVASKWIIFRKKDKKRDVE